MKSGSALLVLALAVAPTAARAQTKDQIVADWTRHRGLVLAIVDAMPDSAIAFQPAPDAHSFAAQIQRIADVSVDVAARAIRGLAQPPFVADTAQTLHQKTALRAHVAQSYDYMIEALRGATPARLARMVTLEAATRSGARWIAAAQEQTIWTLGACVGYLRLNGVTPPEYPPM